MDMVLGLILWAGIIYLIVVWRSRSRQSRPRAGRGAPQRPTLPPAPSRTDDQRRREEEAFVDGLVIGSYFYGDLIHPAATEEDTSWDSSDLHDVDDFADDWMEDDLDA